MDASQKVSVFPLQTEEVWHGLQASVQFLQLHNQEYPGWGHRSLVWEQCKPGLQGYPEGSQTCGAHDQVQTANHERLLHSEEWQEGSLRMPPSAYHQTGGLVLARGGIQSKTSRLGDNFFILKPSLAQYLVSCIVYRSGVI